ncbi:hypothetical protein LMG30234_GAICNKDF_00028 [Fructobacillus fructosus]|uniref:hypothetical protein n=1 Tax=Fructobacillus fructosus TaxID=1631 RepID=UPI002D83F08A|nr:hypothetical protein LMG30234_GAICNKDF_00028 [Fructobacillus fructosus]
MFENLGAFFAVIGTIATAFFAWRGKREDTTQKHDDTLSLMFKAQSDLVKDLSLQVSNLNTEIKKLRTDNENLTNENRELRIEVRSLTNKIDEMMTAN